MPPAMTSTPAPYCYATEAINTPVAPVQLTGDDPVIWCKLEYHNPSGSTKDRIARFILGKAIRSGVLSPGDSVVEASSGSTSISFALMCSQFGLRFTAVMPASVSQERIKMIRAFGAEVRLTPADEGVDGAMALANEIAESENAFAGRQFETPDNPAAHRHQTAAEIVAQVPSRSVDAIVSGVGTGGTLVGLYQGFCDFGCNPLPIVARPVCSEGLYDLECSSFSKKIPGVVDSLSVIFRDAKLPNLREVNVKDCDALDCCRQLIRRGFPVGPSSGLNFAAAIVAAKELPPEATIVTVFPDRMERYFSTPLFDNEAETVLDDVGSKPFAGPDEV